MAIPDFQTLMRPILEFLADGAEHSLQEIVQAMSDQFHLSHEERNRLIPSNQQTYISNRVSWARSHMRAAGLVENPRRGIARLTQAGFDSLKIQNEPINVRFLRRYPSYLEFIGAIKTPDDGGTDEDAELPPQERMELAYVETRNSTKTDLLERLKSCKPAFFEHVVVELLMKMGYGGIAGRGEVTRFAGDGGIDGIINQDKLGLDIVSIQAKRWEGVVGRPIVQGFVGSMDYIRARKGVIITTSKFTRDAEDYVHRIEGKKVVLIDGQELAELMIDHNLGVIVRRTYELKEVSNDFFEEE